MIQRILAFVVFSAPDVEQQVMDQILDSEQLLDCMLASDLSRHPVRGKHNHTTVSVVPLVLEQACLGVALSSEPVSQALMDRFAETQRRKPARVVARDAHTIGGILGGIVQSAAAIKLWDGGGFSVDSWNQCEVAARAITMRLDGHIDSESSGGAASLLSGAPISTGVSGGGAGVGGGGGHGQRLTQRAVSAHMAATPERAFSRSIHSSAVAETRQ
jgi:hypothetical protein